MYGRNRFVPALAILQLASNFVNHSVVVVTIRGITVVSHLKKQC